MKFLSSILFFLFILMACAEFPIHQRHTVKKGETAERIAHRYQISHERLASLNGWADISKFFPQASHVKISDSDLFHSLPIKKIAYVPNLPRFAWPVHGGISSTFGRRWGTWHSGVDIRSAFGTPVRSAALGKVIYSGAEPGYGKLIILYHGSGYSTVYAHMSKLNVRKGQSVKRGQVIAWVGSTGRSTGPHLHFEVRKHQDAYNPLDYLP